METRNSNKVIVSGVARCFHSSTPLARAKIHLLENNTHHFSDDKGNFCFEWEVNQPLTLLLQKENYRSTQSATFIFSDHHTNKPIKIFFQVPHWIIPPTFSFAMGRNEDPKLCQIAGTVTAHGKTLEDLPHGEEGVTVQLFHENHTQVQNKPFYFGIFQSGLLKHKTNPFDRSLTKTSKDGGFIFTNVLPGKYFIKATKEGVSFPEIRVTADSGKFINITPPILVADKNCEEKPEPVVIKKSQYRFFKPALALSAGVLGFATCGIGTAVASAAATYMAAESLSDCCKKRS